MSNTFEIRPVADGTQIKIKSDRIEQFFKSLAGEQYTSVNIAGNSHTLWYNNAVENFWRTLQDHFANGANEAGESEETRYIIPSFRTEHLSQNNTIGVRFLAAKGIKDGKTFLVPNVYSPSAMKKIAIGFQKAMKHLIEDAGKQVVYKVEIYEKDSNQNPEVLEFDNLFV